MRLASGLGLVLCIAAARTPALAAPPAPDPAAAAAEERRLKDTLKARVGHWLTARKELAPKRCWNCNGRGLIRTWVETVPKDRECSRCMGTGKRVSDTALKAVYVSMRSPAWRAAHGEYVPTTDKEAWVLASGRVDHVERVDTTHAVAWTFEDEGSVSKPSRWIRTVEPLTKLQGWFLHDEATDGAWPQKGAPPPPATEPLLPLQADALDAALKKGQTTFRVRSRARIARTLTMDLAFPGHPAEVELPGILRNDSIALARGILQNLGADWDAVRFTFETLIQDSSGKKSLKPYATVSITSSVLTLIPFANLTSDGAFAKFTVDYPPLLEGEGRIYAVPEKK